ncbi:hypothetical protein X770_10115 [Mesorhizobium sp. LSJC269B00]|nr:hypothetical protein X770_10115 [Mesorhizobium sp. LSJC269B00]
MEVGRTHLDFVILGRSRSEAPSRRPRDHALAMEAAEQNLQRSVAQKSRHGSSGLRRVATLLASPVDDDGMAFRPIARIFDPVLQMR